MKVGIDARLVAGTSTGDSSYWTCLVQALSESFPDDEFLLFSNIARPPGVPVAPNLRWHVVPTQNARIWSLSSFPRAAKKLGCDVTHVQYSLSPFARNPVTTIHDVSFFIGPQWFPPKDQALLARTVPISAKWAKRVITVSETSRQEIARFIPSVRDKIRVALNAAPFWIQPMNPQEAMMKVAELGIRGPFLLSVSTHWERKNMRLAVEATRELGMPLVLTGKNTEKVREPHVQSVGYVDQKMLCALYSSAKMYLATSLHEGFGIPILEAYRCGCPVICGYGGAMPEVAGTAAIVKRDYDADSWRDSIREALKDASKLDALKSAGYRRETEFTWEKSAKKHMAIYKEAVGE